MALGIWTKLDSWQLKEAFTLSGSFSSSARLALSWFNFGSILEEEFFRLSISCANSLASYLLKFFLAIKASRSDRFLWTFFTFGSWSSMMNKGVKASMRSRDKLSWIAKKILRIESASWTKSAISFSSIGNMSLSQFLISSDKVSWREVVDELILPSSMYSSKLKE